MTLDDLKNIDINNIPGWPLPVKIGGIAIICVALLFGGYWFLIADELAEFEQVQLKEAGLKETYLSKKGMAINLPAYKLQMDDMHQAFGTLLRQLPNKTEVPNLLVDITQAGLGRGLNFVLFKPEKEKPQDFYAELPINIKVTGGYHELGQFVSDLAALPRIVTIGGIDIAADSKTGILTMSAVARTFRYLEPEEIEALKPKTGQARCEAGSKTSWRRKVRRALLPLVLALVMLSGCSSDGLDDLRDFVKNAHADRKPKIEPLPGDQALRGVRVRGHRSHQSVFTVQSQDLSPYRPS